MSSVESAPAVFPSIPEPYLNHNPEFGIYFFHEYLYSI